jgi:hypothetical protein
MKVNKSSITKMLKTLKTAIKISNLIGDFTYKSPNWWIQSVKYAEQSRIGRKLHNLREWRSTNQALYRKYLWGAIASITLALVGVYLIRDYFKSLPVPDYVKFTTSSPSSAQPLKIAFNKSVIKIESIGKDISHNLKIEPNIKGDWAWQTDRILEFNPDLSKGDWEAGQTYQVKMNEALFSPNIHFSDYKATFTTDPLVLQFTKDEFYIDPTNADTKRVVATIK